MLVVALHLPISPGPWAFDCLINFFDGSVHNNLPHPVYPPNPLRATRSTQYGSWLLRTAEQTAGLAGVPKYGPSMTRQLCPRAGCQVHHSGGERETGRGAARSAVKLRARPPTVPRNNIRTCANLPSSLLPNDGRQGRVVADRVKGPPRRSARIAR